MLLYQVLLYHRRRRLHMGDTVEAEVEKVGKEQGTCRTSDATRVTRWDTTRASVRWWRQGDSIWQHRLRRLRRLRYLHQCHRVELQGQHQVTHRSGDAKN